MLDLDHYVFIELAIEWMEIVIGGLRAIRLQIGPIEMMVVKKGAVEDDYVVRLEGSRNDVRSIGRRTAIRRGSEASLGIGLHDETAEVWNQAKYLMDFTAPPLLYSRIEGIKSIQASDCLWAAEVHR